MGEPGGKRSVALQQTKGNRAAERIDEEIDIGAGTNLASLDRALQYGARHRSATFGELRQEGCTRVRIQLRLGDQPEERLACNRSRLQMHYGLYNLPQVAGNI